MKKQGFQPSYYINRPWDLSKSIENEKSCRLSSRELHSGYRMIIREKTMIFLDYALTGLQYILISVTLTAILSWCDIYFAMKNILRDLGVWCGVFNAMPKNTRICQKNLLRLLGVEVRSHTLAIQKNLLPVVCNQIFFINDTGLGASPSLTT